MVCTNPERLTTAKQQKLMSYFEQQPAVKHPWLFCQELAKLCRNKGKKPGGCKKIIRDLLRKVGILKSSPFRPMRTLGKSITSWIEPIAYMFRYYRSHVNCRRLPSKNEVDTATGLWLQEL